MGEIINIIYKPEHDYKLANWKFMPSFVYWVRKGPNVYFKSYQKNENMLSNLRIGKLTKLNWWLVLIFLHIYIITSSD